jgi:uncharacterized protein
MSTPIRWKQSPRIAALDARVDGRPDGRAQTPFRTLALNLGQAARSALSEPFRLTVEHHKIFLRRLPRAFDGLRVVQLSDIHHSPFTSREQIERAVETANSLRPDIIALTGDYVSKERAYAAPCAELMGRLRARHGVFAVLGNHDHWTDAALITDLFRAEGITVLVNQGMRFEKDGAALWLAGVDDTMVGLEDLPLALAGAREDELKLLLAHNPIILRRAERAGVDLVLSGHTHGGQVTLRSDRSDRSERSNRPGASVRPRRRLVKGLAKRGETQIYVTRGLGTVVLPVRFGCPPEVSLLELRSGRDG